MPRGTKTTLTPQEQAIADLETARRDKLRSMEELFAAWHRETKIGMPPSSMDFELMIIRTADDVDGRMYTSLVKAAKKVASGDEQVEVEAIDSCTCGRCTHVEQVTFFTKKAIKSYYKVTYPSIISQLDVLKDAKRAYREEIEKKKTAPVDGLTATAIKDALNKALAEEIQRRSAPGIEDIVD